MAIWVKKRLFTWQFWWGFLVH